MLAFVFNGPQLHMLVNHIPVIGLPIAMAAIVYGLFRKSDAVLGFAMLLVIACALGTGAAKLTGEEAEEVVEEMADVSHGMIHEHEEAAELVVYAAVVLALMAAASLVMGRGDRTMPRPLVLGVLLLGLGVSGYVGYVAHLGGIINHPEIRDGSANVQGLNGDEDDDDSGRDRNRGRGGDDD